MKKNKIKIACVGIGAYALTLGTMVTLDNWTEKTSKHNELLEIEMSVNALTDMVQEDTHCGNLNEYSTWYYLGELDKINGLIEELKNE